MQEDQTLKKKVNLATKLDQPGLPNTAAGKRPTATCSPRNWAGKHHHALSNWVASVFTTVL